MDPEKLAYESGCQGWFKGDYKKYFSQPTAQSSKSKVIQSLNERETHASQAFHILLSSDWCWAWAWDWGLGLGTGDGDGNGKWEWENGK